MHPQRNVILTAQMINENESGWELHKQLARAMQQGEKERKDRERQFGDHEHMAKDIDLPSDKEFARYRRNDTSSTERGMDFHINRAADTIKRITDTERKHHEENRRSLGYKGWLSRIDDSYGGGTAKEHIDRLKQDAFDRYTGANGIRTKEEYAGHIDPFNRAFNNATRRMLEHPPG